MIYAIVVVLILIADQAMKFWTTKNILLGAIGDDCASLIPGVVHITNVHNYGAAFSILQHTRWLLVAITLIFVLVIIVLMNREIIHTRFGRWTVTLVLAGALGNCIDRVLYGYVVDMFEFEFFSFPVFNVADIFITVAGILFCIHLILHNEPEAVKAANEPEFMRRRREEKAAKEAPYANIPPRGEHKTLEEELGGFDPDDPFGEWEFGKAITEPKPEPKPDPGQAPQPEPADEPDIATAEAPEPKSAPAPKRFTAKEDLFSNFLFEPGAEEAQTELPPPAAKPAAEPEPEPEPQTQPEAIMEAAEESEPQAQPAEVPEGPAENAPLFSLEDILAEFGDL